MNIDISQPGLASSLVLTIHSFLMRFPKTSFLPRFIPLLPRNKVHRKIEQGLRGLHENQARKGAHYLPNFIIIGAAKSATTTLATILPRHPDIFLSRPKEPKFFGRRYAKGWRWYRKIFRPGRGFMFRGEASTMYASTLGSFRYAPRLIHRYLPDVKIIYVVRHPIDRLVSQWRHLKGRRPDYVDFQDILSNRRARDLLLGCSKYFSRIEEFRKYFPDDQIHCITFEDLIEDPSRVLSDLLTFLGASARPELLLDDGRLPRVNEAGDKGRAFVEVPDFPAKMRNKIANLLKPDAELFLDYIGKDPDYWVW
ncbi:sulfotransferase [Cyanobium sp. CH-040]|uniref:sulfotransferase family protein n=1 Tax=Cyanobium sp. CH-040 TaxID=2823708 RepID=UPI0020CFA259|nr:sulfotransferase [Cyanobium sp. CH-040]MCP9927996.1 sulfotransferase [Cyanobium sp. CH-040]